MSDSPFTVPPSPAQPVATNTEEDRTVAILSYITIVGFIVAIVMHGNKKTALGAFHLRQTLGLFIAGLIVWVGVMIIAFIPIINLLNIIIGPVVGLGFFVLWILGLVAAASGQQKPVPVVGETIQRKFANAFN